MFTGIVEEIGTVNGIRRGRHSAVLDIRAQTVLTDLKIGDSIAVNGVCLTVTAFDQTGFQADVMHETLNRSALRKLCSGSHVNLERAMAANGRFGGHIVAEVKRDDTAVWYTIEASPEILHYIVEKGSVAIDGISLTVARVASGSFSISAIPHTVRMTVLAERREGDLVNLENDVIGKYVERLFQPAKEPARTRPITKEFLAEYGF